MYNFKHIPIIRFNGIYKLLNMWALKKELSTNNFFFFQSISATEVTALSVYLKKKKRKKTLRGTLRQESQFTE